MVLAQLDHNERPLTRLALAKITGLSPIWVNKHLTELIKEGYINAAKDGYRITGNGSTLIRGLGSAMGAQTDNPAQHKRAANSDNP